MVQTLAKEKAGTQTSATSEIQSLNLDATGQGSFDVASVNPVNPEFNINQLNNEKEPINVSDLRAEADKRTFYLPKDEELRNKILDARDDINTIIIEMQKQEYDNATIMNYIDMYLRDNNLTKDQISGAYPNAETDFVMAFTQGANKRLLEIADNIIDFSYFTSPNLLPMQNMIMEGKFSDIKPDIDFTPANEQIKNKLYEVFEFLHFIDPSFTPDTFAERMADNAGAFVIDALPFSGVLTKATAGNKIAIKDPEALKGIFAKTKNNIGLLYNQIIDIYDNAKKTGKLGSLVADDILAVMGFSMGTDFGKKLAAESTDGGLLGTPLSLGIQTFAPFIGGGAFIAGKKYLYDVPIATYQAGKNFIKNFSEFNQSQPDEGVLNNLVQYYKNKNNEKKAAEISQNIKTQINEDEINARNEALEVENRLNQVVVVNVEKDAAGNDILVQRITSLPDEGKPSLDFTLAQSTKNPNLRETQQKIESDLINSGFTLNIGGRGKAKEEAGQFVKNLSLSNYKIVDEALEREFPNKQYVYTTALNDEGKQVIVAVEQKVGNFGSYFNSNNRVGGVIDQEIDDQLQTTTEILTPGSTATKTDLTVSGSEIRSKYEKQKQNALDLYDNKLLQLINDNFGDRTFDVSDLKDSIITKIKPTDFDRKVDIPLQFYAIRDLGNDFAPVINNANRQINAAYDAYLESPTTQNYKVYMEKIFQIEKNLKNQLDNLNSTLAKQVESGDRPIAPVYNMGDIEFTYPSAIKFNAQGKVIKGIDEPGKSYMGRDLTDGSSPGVGVPGSQVEVKITDPTMDINSSTLISLKQSAQRDLNLALRNPSENSELIKRLKVIVEEVDKVITDNLGGTKFYDDWLKEKTKNYTNIYEKGQILKITTQDGTAQYIIPDEGVGKAFLKNPQSVDEFFSTVGGDPAAIKGIEDAFYDDMYKKILNSDGLIDINKLKTFRKNNSAIIEALDQYLPISETLDSQIKLGVNAANRMKILTDRKKFADFIELDALIADGGLGTGLTFKNSDDMVKQALKDPEIMTDIVKTLSKIEGENKDVMLSAFKNKLFDKFLASAKSEKPVFDGGMPKTSGMSKFLFENEDAIKAFYNAQNDVGGYQRLKDIVFAYERLNLTGYPKRVPDALPNKVQQIFGSGIPQILSRIFAVQSGRTSSRFVGAELGMRFMEKLSTAQREKIIAAALYDRNNAEALLNMLQGNKLTLNQLNTLKAIFGKTYGIIGTTVSGELEETPRPDVPFGFDAIDIPAAKSRIENNPRLNLVNKPLNIPQPSNASSLAGINMSAVTPSTTPNNIAKGQALFGINDPIFGGINTV